jgi:hypothetical protein
MGFWPSVADLAVSPWAPAAVALLVGVGMVLGRLVLVDHGDITRFIGLGVIYTHRSGLPPGLFVSRGAGWDGQYFYRLALDPLDLHRTAFGITLDTPYRLQRLGYPVLVWLAAAGRSALVPWALVGVNVAALGVLGGLGGRLARDSGRPAMWGVLFAGYWGFPLALSWDLTGVVLAAMLVAALLALRRHRPVLATFALTAAVLTKETALILVAAVALAELIAPSPAPAPPPHGEGVDQRRFAFFPRRRRHLVWAVPLVVFAAWQVVLRLLVGGSAIGGDAGANLGLPLVALVDQVVRDLRHIGNVVFLIDLAEIALIVGLVALALVTSWRTATLVHERYSLLGLTGLALCLSGAVWGGKKDLRSLAELFTVAMVVLVSSRRRLLAPAALVGYAWALIAVIQTTKM